MLYTDRWASLIRKKFTNLANEVHELKKLQKSIDWIQSLLSCLSRYSNNPNSYSYQSKRLPYLNYITDYLFHMSTKGPIVCADPDLMKAESLKATALSGLLPHRESPLTGNPHLAKMVYLQMGF